MSERSILFSAPMIRAILSGTKSQTRRVVNLNRARCASDCAGPKPEEAWVDPGGTIFGPGPYLHVPCDDGAAQRVRCPYGYPEDGARLWVRETWMQFEEAQTTRSVNGGPPRPTGDVLPGGIAYRADMDSCGQVPLGPATERTWRTPKDNWRPSIFMPRSASRIDLEIVSVRVERLQKIRGKDILAEGVVDRPHDVDGLGKCPVSSFDGKVYVDLISLWAAGWDMIYGKTAPWASNPFVWVIEFLRTKP